MKPIFIVGAGGAAKEILSLVEKINKEREIYDLKGCIDIGKKRSLQIGSRTYTIHEESTFLNQYKEKAAIVFGLGDPVQLKKVVHRYQQYANLEFPNILHPSIKLDESVALGIGNIIAEGCICTVDISLRSFNYINRGVHIGHDCTIGSFNVINPNAVLSGGLEMGNENLVGTHATVLQYLKVGSKNSIGAGAVLTKDVTDKMRLIGIPAKNMKT